MLTEGVVEKPGEPTHNYYVSDQTFLFSVGGEKGTWVNCRDDFAENINRAKQKDFFIRPTVGIALIASFVRRLEEVMGIQPFTVMQQAKYKVKAKEDDDLPKKGKKPSVKVVEFDDAMYIQPSSFWSAHPLRMSFLSAAIKLVDFEEEIKLPTTAKGMAAYLIDIDDDQEYFLPTQFATRRFLTGYTAIHRSRKKPCGWRDVFDSEYHTYGRPKKRIARILQRP
jgi:hypothetical protein